MTPGSGRFLRDNVFLVAAVSLPLVVVAFFLLSTAIPRWTVSAACVRSADARERRVQLQPDESAGDRSFNVRDGKVEATISGRPGQRVSIAIGPLFLFDHATLSVSEIPVELPDKLVLVEGDPPRTIVVDTPPGRRVLAQARAPDGYQLETRSQRGPGIVGELFGMHRYNSDAVLTNRGRVIPITLPAPFQISIRLLCQRPSAGWSLNPRNGQR